MSEMLTSEVPRTKGHAHFFDTIESFPGLNPGPSFEARNNYIKDTVKYQIMTGSAQKAERYINLRECFKFNERKYVDFCLQHKVPGTSIESAATELGLRK